MKRITVGIYLACSIVACTAATPGQAQVKPTTGIFPTIASCNEQALTDLPNDIKNKEVVTAQYVDEASPRALKAAAIDAAFSRLTEEAYRLLDASQFDTLKPHVAKTAVVKAYWILQRDWKVRRPESLAQPLWNDDDTSILYQCFSDTCPAGTTCTQVGGRVRADKLAQAIAQQRRLVNKTLEWAKAANRPLSERRSLRENFQRNENALRKLLKNAPPEIFRSTTRVARK